MIDSNNHTSSATRIAEQNFQRHLANNRYPGRGLVIGRNSAESWTILYWIMGRSTHSRNRRFVADGTTLRTEARDPALVKDPSLIIYEAMLDLPGTHLVSNGDHTRTLYDALSNKVGLSRALATREREPDAPNYTPRISGMLSPQHAQPLVLSILKANAIDPSLTDRHLYRPATPTVGLGYGLTTYMGDGNPLPSYTGEPLLLPCAGDGEALLTRYWDALDGENRIALAVKMVSAEGVRLLVKNQ